jgi:PAS domain S-box-containing protein
MPEFIAKLFSSGSFIPHGHCYLWQSELVWLHILSDSLIALAYYSIPITLVYFAQKRKDLPFDWIFFLFSAFIISCGTTHLMEVWTLWHPTYWLSGALKAFTAIISLYTAIALVKLMPQALAIPSPAQLSTANRELTQQIRDRQQAEDRVRQLNQTLEVKVAQRTAELETSMGQVQDYVERTALAMDAAKMGSFDWDLVTQKVTWSHYHEILWGYQSGTAERTYQDWIRRIHPDDLAKAEGAIKTARATATDYSSEYRVIWEDGTMHWVAGFGRFYFTRNGEPFRMMGIVQNITERKQVEASLQLSEERLRLATEAADIGMWFWDLIEDRLVWTHCCKRLFGLNPDTAVSYKRFLEALHPEDRDRTHAAVEQAVKDRQEYTIEYRSVWGDGSTHWLLAKGRAFYDERDKPIRMMGIAQDITDRKLTEVVLQEQARELSQVNAQLMETTELVNQRNLELDRFAHIISHDLKAPLRAIANLSEWIEEDLADRTPPESKHNLALLRARVARMNALIDGLLSYARVGYQETSCETFDLNELLLEIVDSLDIPPQFAVQLPQTSLTISANRLLLSQVFANLISNAVKHHDRPDGRAIVTAQAQEEVYSFSVADDGIGIAPKYHSRIFDIFQTLQQNKEDSTGIGLAIIKKIIERIGGQIRLESELGQGAAFYFTWPMRVS